jgi:hypothetical protein
MNQLTLRRRVETADRTGDDCKSLRNLVTDPQLSSVPAYTAASGKEAMKKKCCRL